MIILLLLINAAAIDNQITIKRLTSSTINLQVQFSDLNQNEQRPITRFIIANSPPQFEYKINQFDSSANPNQGEAINPMPVCINEPIKVKNCKLYPVVIYPNYLNEDVNVFYKSIEIALSYQPSAAKPNFSPSLKSAWQGLILNLEDSGDSTPLGYLIITANSFYNAVLPLAAWKEKKGWKVTVAKLSETGSSAGAIKDYIANAYNTWSPPPEYVLLIGDKDSLPAAASLTPVSTTDYPYTLVEGNDFLAELLIGRLPALNNNELNTMVSKIVNYEQNPDMSDPAWFERALMVGANYPGFMTTPIPTKRWVREKMLESGFNTVDTVFYPPVSSSTPITNSVNQGVLFVNYRAGDGNLNGWVFPTFTNTEVQGLSNGWRLPIVTSITCYTGNFGAQTCFGEAWLRAGTPTNPKGAVGYIGGAGSSTSSRWNNCLDYGIYWAFLEESIYNLGPILYRGKMEVFTNFPNDTAWANGSSYYFHTFGILGDPSLDVWTGVPDTFRVTHVTTLSVGTNNLAVLVKDSQNQPVNNAMVSLYKENDVKEVAFSDASGNVDFNFSTTTQDTLFVTVTKHNFKPYCGYCLVNNAGVYVGYFSHQTNDPGGNNNNEVNPGETIQMPVTLKNYGNATTATNISAKLTTDDSFTTITDSIKTYSNISPGSTAVGAPFIFDVSTTAPNSHIIEFHLAITSSQGSWNSSIWVETKAPEFIYQRNQILDGGNGVLDPGETSDIIISIQNRGGLIGNGINGILRSNSPGVSVIDSLGSFGNIAIGDSGTNSGNHFRVSASAGLAAGHPIIFKTILSGSNDFIDSIAFAIIVGVVDQTKPLGPDGYGYFAYDNTDAAYVEKPTYNWVEIDPALGGSGTVLNLGNDETKTVNLPFSFKYYGNSYNKVSICSNGYIAMDSTWIADMYNWHIPAAGGPPLLIAPFWDDLDPNATDSSGNVCYWNDGTNHRFIIEYSRIQHLHDPTDPVPAELQTFETILYNPQNYPTATGDGEILFQYKTINNDDQWHNYATVGIENYAHTTGLEYSYDNNYPATAAPLANNRAIKFTTDPPDTFPYPGVHEQISRLNSTIPMLSIYPNPFKHRTEIKYSAGNSAPSVDLKIYDVTGRLVRDFPINQLTIQPFNQISWDGSDDLGRKLPEGIYLVRFRTEDYQKTEKIIFLR